jgi:hypothetical protein
MAAKVLEGANLVWQRVDEFMRLQQSATSPTSPISRAALLRDLKVWLATQKGNPKLQYASFTNVTAAVNVGVSTGGATLYALFLKKHNTATAAYFRFNDTNTTVGGANGANQIGIMPLLVGGDEVLEIFVPGLVLATGLGVESATTAAGGTDSTSGDGPNGFAIFG